MNAEIERSARLAGIIVGSAPVEGCVYMTGSEELEAFARLIAAEAEKAVAKLKELALSDNFDASKMRIWGGSKWTYSSIYAKRIYDRTQKILDEMK